MSPTPAAQDGNRRRQAALRARRRANMTRLTVWLPRETHKDFAALADSLQLTHTELLAGLIRRAAQERAGQQVIPWS